MIKLIKSKGKTLLIVLILSVPNIGKPEESPNLELLEKNDQYFIKKLDLNGDKLLDKLVSSKRHEADELYFFIKQGKTYHYALQSSNFSEDGRNLLKKIQAEDQHGEVLSISTYFPDGGHLTAQHFIAFEDNDWFLTRTVYETTDWKKDPSKTYICNVEQNIRLRSFTDGGSGWGKFKRIPNKNRDELCKLEIQVND